MEDYSFSFNGFLFGEGTDYDVTEVTGLHDFTTETPVEPWEADHGGYPAEGFHRERRLTFTIDIVGEPGADLAAKRNALRRAFQPVKGNTEKRLFVKLPGEPVMFIWCRPARLSSPMTISSELGVAPAVVEFVASDPVFYGTTPVRYQIAPWRQGGGVTYPVTYDKEYGAPAMSGTVVTNEGDWVTWPVFEIRGPSSGFGEIRNLVIEDLTNGHVIDLSANGGVTISSGQTLIIDTSRRSRRVAFSTGASRYGNLTNNSVMFPLAPGDTHLRWRAEGDTQDAAVYVTFHHARL